jgi:hypothetical protein
MQIHRRTTPMVMGCWIEVEILCDAGTKIETESQNQSNIGKLVLTAPKHLTSTQPRYSFFKAKFGTKNF